MCNINMGKALQQRIMVFQPRASHVRVGDVRNCHVVFLIVFRVGPQMNC